MVQRLSRVTTCTDVDTNRTYSMCGGIVFPDTLSFGITFIRCLKEKLPAKA